MTEARSISEALVPLISRDDIPLKAIAIVGEIIAVDARLRDFDQGPTKRTTGDQLGEFLETYDVLLQRTLSAIEAFLKTQNREGLMKVIREIKEGLTALY